MKLRVFLVFLLVFAAYAANAFIEPFPLRLRSLRLRSVSTTGSSTFLNNGDVQYGVSWSFEQAGWYGLDPRKSYTKLLDKVKFDWVRLPFFWDQMTDEGGNLKIDDLKFAIEEAQTRNVKVVIALGAKTPYYPEFHIPQNLKAKVKFGDLLTSNHPIASDLLDIDKKLVESLAGYNNIIYWQVENEPFLANVDNIKFDKSLIVAEVDAVREVDLKKRPIILNHVGPSLFDQRYKKLFEILKPGDILGVNAYFETQGVNLFATKILGREIRIPWPKWFVWPVQSWAFLSPDFAALRHEAQSREVDLWVLEMQAEPYIRMRADADKSGYFYSPRDIMRADNYIRESGLSSIGFWGAPFWLHREDIIGDNSWVNAVRQLTNNN